MTQPYNVLIGIMYFGENEYEHCLDAIDQQTFRNFKLDIRENEANSAAHNNLYRSFMEHRSEFTHFLKLDADMVFMRPTALEEMVTIFDGTPELDVLKSDVHDWMSDMLTLGLNMYSSRVQWQTSTEYLFVDSHGHYPGLNMHMWTTPAPFVTHSPDPSGFQSFAFGLHRAMKSLELSRKEKSGMAPYQFMILDRTWMAYQKHGDVRRLYALQAADLVFADPERFIGYAYKGEDAEALFAQTCGSVSETVLLSQLSEVWSHSTHNLWRWLEILGRS